MKHSYPPFLKHIKGNIMDKLAMQTSCLSEKTMHKIEYPIAEILYLHSLCLMQACAHCGYE